VSWYRQADKRGLAQTQYNLAVIDANRMIGKRDWRQAYFWFALALTALPAGAKQHQCAEDLERAKGMLNASDRAHADEIVLGWKRIG
jgi:localization factor PodJL